MTTGLDILSQVTAFSKYAKYLESQKRRELWNETVDRNVLMHTQKFPQLAVDITDAFDYVRDKRVLPSMRSMQFAGKPIELAPNRIFNCGYIAIDHPVVFREIMFLLLGGTGIGWSVQHRHVKQLPVIRKPVGRRRYLVDDSIMGWANAIDELMKAYFYGLEKPVFDFRGIRPKGSILKTTGGRAPGPDGLALALERISGVLSSNKEGSPLSPLQVHDICCHISDSVLSGGIRRAAAIGLFDLDDEEMLHAKAGNWWTENPQRARANNSAVVLRHRITQKKFRELWRSIEDNKSGEPGIYFSNHADMGTNPCAEISLRPAQFCNLTTINGSLIRDQKDLAELVGVAAFIGTLQASYTDFHYLRSVWKKQTERDALIGVSMTGVARSDVYDWNLQAAAETVLRMNEEIAAQVGIKPAARATCLKPEGTSSAVLGTGSGVHAWHSPHFIRRTRYNVVEPIAQHLKEMLPEFIEESREKPGQEIILALPIKAPEGAITRDESALDMLQRVKHFADNWVKPGHRDGHNTHNVSATVSVREGEWKEVGEWMWSHRDSYNGLSVLPYDGGTYVQAPFEEITAEEYAARATKLPPTFSLINVSEDSDQTTVRDELACAGGSCEIP